MSRNLSNRREWRGQAQECAEEAEPAGYCTRKEAAAHELADRMKEAIRQEAPEPDGIYGDLLGAALCEVNWDEIAAAWLDDVKWPEADEIEEEAATTT